MDTYSLFSDLLVVIFVLFWLAYEALL